jgi:hypothetical protein
MDVLIIGATWEEMGWVAVMQQNVIIPPRPNFKSM